MPRGPLEPPQENITSLSPYRFLRPQAPMMSDMFVELNNKTLVGCTKAAGSFCCQRWQAESPYCSLDNGGARWYGIVLRHYTQLRSFLLSLREEVICHHTRFNFLWITKRLKKKKKWRRCFPSVPKSWADEGKQSARDCRVTSGFKCTSLEALRENPSENTHHLHRSCDLWAWWWSSGLVIWEFGNQNKSFKKLQETEAEACLWWCHSEANLMTSLKTQTVQTLN